MSLLSRSSALAAVSLAALIAARAARRPVASPLREQSATAQGYSFAGAASGSGGLSSMFWNPATITMAAGLAGARVISRVIIPRVEIDAVRSDPTLALRRSGRYRRGCGRTDELLLATSSTIISGSVCPAPSPFGLVTDPRENWSGQVYSRSSRIFSLNVNPIVGVKVNDWLSRRRRSVAAVFRHPPEARRRHHPDAAERHPRRRRHRLRLHGRRRP